MINIYSVTDGPKILFYDIETCMGYAEIPFYQLKQYSKYINPNLVKRPVSMICAAWKWDHQNFVTSTSVLKDPERFEADPYDDYHVVKFLHQVISEADVVVAHNGDNFDWKMLNWRCAVHGLEPPKPPVKIDTLKMARKEFKAESKSLRYLAKHLGVEDKGESPDWNKISMGCPEEIAYAEKYCRQDIKTLIGVYERIRPFASNHPNLNPMLDGVHHNTCSRCGSDKIKKNGYKHTRAGKYQAYKCNDCGSHSQGKKNLRTVEIR